MEADGSSRKRVREHGSDDKLEFDWAEVKRLRDDLLSDLAFDDDETDDNNPQFAATQDLDSFMRSLEEEIVSGASSSQEVNFIDLTSEPGESDSGDNNPEFAATRELDSFVRGLQEEIVSCGSSLQEVNLIDLTSEPDESDSGNKNPEFAATRGLDSYMRSLHEEIGSAASSSQEAIFIDLTSEPGESDSVMMQRQHQPSSNKVVINLENDWDRVECDSSQLSELWDY